MKSNKLTSLLLSILITITLLGILLVLNLLTYTKQDNRLDTIEAKQALTDKWFNSVHNPYNQPFVLEISTELDIHPDSITQEQFYERYLKHE